MAAASMYANLRNSIPRPNCRSTDVAYYNHATDEWMCEKLSRLR